MAETFSDRVYTHSTVVVHWIASLAQIRLAVYDEFHRTNGTVSCLVFIVNDGLCGVYCVVTVHEVTSSM